MNLMKEHQQRQEKCHEIYWEQRMRSVQKPVVILGKDKEIYESNHVRIDEIEHMLKIHLNQIYDEKLTKEIQKMYGSLFDRCYKHLF